MFEPSTSVPRVPPAAVGRADAPALRQNETKPPRQREHGPSPHDTHRQSDQAAGARRADDGGPPADEAAREQRDRLIADAAAEAVRQQVEVGLDVINDGEMGKANWISYLYERVDGIEFRRSTASDRPATCRRVVTARRSPASTVSTTPPSIARAARPRRRAARARRR